MSPESRSARSTRRSFLKALGSSAALLPFYGMLENHFVHAQTGRLPLKLIAFGFFHGHAAQHWARRPGETDDQFDLIYPDSPFLAFDDPATYGVSFKDRLTIFEGFDFGVGEYDLHGRSMHVPMHGAMGLLLTGSCKQGERLQNASLDQHLAAQYGGMTRFRSLQFRGYDQLGNPLDPGWSLSFDSGGNALAPFHEPTEIWDTVFSRAVLGSHPDARAVAERQRAVGASILDFVSKDIARMQARLAAPEREKLDQHLTVLRDLEQRLSDTSVSTACTAPNKPDPGSGHYELDKFEPGNVRPICDLSLALMAEAVVCDLTRFVTFLLPNEFGPTSQLVTLPYDGSKVPAVDGTTQLPEPLFDTMHDNCAHRLDDGTSSQALLSQRMVTAINRLYFARIAGVMKRLHEADLLDSTVIFAGSDGGHGSAHSTQHVPMLLAGGTGHQVRLGRRIVAPGRTAQPQGVCTGAELTAHNAVLVAIANLFGDTATSYGTCGVPELTQGVSSLLG